MVTRIQSDKPASESNLAYVTSISLVATLGGFLFGFDSGVINGTVEGLKVTFSAGNEVFDPAFSVASMLLGSAVGAFFAGQLSDKFGRRNMLMFAGLLFIISAWGSGLANTEVSFIIYRIIGGLAVGAASVLAPAYISEVSPAEIRGRLSSIQQVAIISGLFLAFVSNYFLARASGSSLEELWGGYQTWRWMFWMEIFPATIFFGALFLIPQSPRYAMLRGQEENAFKTLSKILGTDAARKKLEEIKASLDKSERPRLADLLQRGGGIKPVVWVGIGLAAFQQLVGINVVFYYGAVLWQAVGFAESDALLINVLSGSLSILAVLITLWTVDKIGRKPFLIAGSVGMTITLGIVSYAFSTGSVVEGSLVLPGNMGLLALVSANAYVFFFNLSWGPIMWVMLGEMFPNRIRGSGLAVAGLVQWFTNFVVTWSFPKFLGSIGLTAAYALYAIFAFFSIFFVLKMVIETKGRELEEMTG